MPRPELRMSFANRAALEQELSTNLKHGRAFVREAQAVQVLADCVLVLIRPDDGAELELLGQAVFVSDSGAMCGVGVELRPFDAEVVAKLDAFCRGERVSGVRETVADPGEAAQPSAAAKGEEPAEAVDPEPAEPNDAQLEADEAPVAPTEDEAPSASELQQQRPALERMRKISVAQQQKIARSGELNDRVALERLYGKAVWDGLLHNPKLTIPEVAQIARKGSAPRPLLELIVDNNSWIQAPLVRRALLGNPRVSGEAILKLLRITPKHELKTIYKTTAYSAQVREAARKVLEL